MTLNAKPSISTETRRHMPEAPSWEVKGVRHHLWMPPLAAHVGTFANRASRTAVIATCSSADFGSLGFIRAEVGFTTCVLRRLSIMFQPQDYAVRLHSALLQSLTTVCTNESSNRAHVDWQWETATSRIIVEVLMLDGDVVWLYTKP